jgi:hypothetical protein
MTVKKSYKNGDSVWVYGIARNNNKLHKGEVLHSFTLEHAGWNNEPHYVIAIPNEIEPLLEVRTWHNISQDSKGPVGCFRHEIPKEEMDSVDKKMSQLGLTIEEYDRFEEHMSEDDEEVSPDAIHRALIKSQTDASHAPLVYTENKPNRKRYQPRKKKRD